MKSLKTMNNKPHIVITTETYKKIRALIELSSIECQYELFIRRLPKNNMIFEIYDVDFMEQVNTSCHTEATDEGQQAFIQKYLATPETRAKYCTKKGHGHSHVNMQVHPSGPDDAFRRSIIRQIVKDNPTPNDFFYFEIRNKKGDYSFEIWDAYTNTIYDQKDCTYEIGALGIDNACRNWAETVLKKLVVTKPEKSTTYLPKSFQNKRYNPITDEWEDKEEEEYT